VQQGYAVLCGCDRYRPVLGISNPFLVYTLKVNRTATSECLRLRNVTVLKDSEDVLYILNTNFLLLNDRLLKGAEQCSLVVRQCYLDTVRHNIMCNQETNILCNQEPRTCPEFPLLSHPQTGNSPRPFKGRPSSRPWFLHLTSTRAKNIPV
jgi:hypothetical protein